MLVATGVRVHFFEDGGGIKKVPYARFQRLLAEDSNERIEEYAGKRVRCAMTFVELKNRKAIRIIQTDFMIIPFAHDGAVDREEFRRRASLAINMLDFGMRSQDGNVVNLVPKLSKNRYLREFVWVATQAEIRAIVSDVLPT